MTASKPQLPPSMMGTQMSKDKASDQHGNYFQSPAHELLLKHYTLSESERLMKVTEEEGVEHAISMSMAILMFYATALRRINLGEVVDGVLKLSKEDADKDDVG